MFAGDDDASSLYSLDLASGSLVPRRGSANGDATPTGAQNGGPHWSSRYTQQGFDGRARSGSEASNLTGARGRHSRETSGNSLGPNLGYWHGHHHGKGAYAAPQAEYEDEFGWSGSAGGIKGRDDRQIERDAEFERQIEDRRRRRLARKKAKEQGLPEPPPDQPLPDAGTTPTGPESILKDPNGTIKGRKTYRPVFAPTEKHERDLHAATPSASTSGQTSPTSPTSATTTAAETPGAPTTLEKENAAPARKGVTLVDDGVVEEPVAQPKVSRAKSFRLKRPNILRSHSEVVRGSKDSLRTDPRPPASPMSPGAKHYAFLDQPHSQGSQPGGAAAGLKRGMSLKDKVGAALGRFGSTRRPRAVTMGDDAAAAPTRPAAMRRKSSRPPTEGVLAEAQEGEKAYGGGSEQGFGGLVRKMSRKLSEDPEREARRREAFYYEPPKLSHVLVGDKSPFPPRPPLGALSTAADQPPSFHRATAGGLPRGSSYMRTPYEEDGRKKAVAA